MMPAFMSRSPARATAVYSNKTAESARHFTFDFCYGLLVRIVMMGTSKALKSMLRTPLKPLGRWLPQMMT